MATSTTANGGRFRGTSRSVRTDCDAVPAHRLISGLYGTPSRTNVVLQGRFVIGPEGTGEVVISIDQKAFNRAMAVREINNRIDGSTSVDIDAKTLTATSR